MSGDSSQEKTEEASHRKLEKAREHGQVARSTDLPSTLVLTVVIFYLWFTWDWTLQQLQEVFVLTPQLFAMDFHQALQAGFQTIIYQPMLTIALPLALVATLAGIIGNLIQFGFLFSFESITPNFSKISLSSGFQRMFSAKQAITTLLSLFKTLIISGRSRVSLPVPLVPWLRLLRRVFILFCQKENFLPENVKSPVPLSC